MIQAIKHEHVRAIHLADIHIKTLKYIKEYREIFDNFYILAKKENPDIICIAGDLLHEKLTLSPECVSLAADFLTKTSAIAPTYIIPGNHDLSEKNRNRQDAITPIVEALHNPNIHYSVNSRVYHINEGVDLYAWSLVDKDNWQKPTDNTKTNILMYHGSVAGCITDGGFKLDKCNIKDLSVFNMFDVGILGDIHKRQFLDKYQRFGYCGSLSQQNHGEDPSKGFLVWDITSKNKFTTRFVEVPNPYPFVTFYLTDNKLPKNIPDKGNVRLIHDASVNQSTLDKCVKIFKSKSDITLQVIKNKKIKQSNKETQLISDSEKQNLRDSKIQEQLIAEFILKKESDTISEIIENVFKLNDKYNKLAVSNTDIARNVEWSIDSLEWTNLFNYGPDNSIDFSKLEGIVSLIGPNHCGKSSVIDTLLYTLCNTISKKNGGLNDIINHVKAQCSGKLYLTSGNKQYQIERTTERLKKKETKTALDFVLNENNKLIELNGTTRVETDSILKRKFGTIEDLLLTMVCSQYDALKFINAGSASRKEILSNFLDLDIFDKKFDLAKKDSTFLKAQIKKIEEKKLLDIVTALISDKRVLNEQCSVLDKQILDINDKQTENDTQLEKKKLELASIEGAINAIVANVDKDIDQKVKSKQEQLDALIYNKLELQKEANNKSELLSKISTFLLKFDIERLKKDKQYLEAVTEDFDKLQDEIKLLESKLNNNLVKSNLLKKVPCGTQYPSCTFICDAHKANKEAKKQRKTLDENLLIQKTHRDKIDSYRDRNLEKTLSDYEKLLEKQKTAQKEFSTLVNNISIKTANIGSVEELLSELKSKQASYAGNYTHDISYRGILMNEINSRTDDKNKLQQDSKQLLEQQKELERKLNYTDQQIINYKEQQKEYDLLVDEQKIYEWFMKAMNYDGVSYDIVKSKLPFINEEINNILSDVIDFEVVLEDEGKKLEIYLQHPGKEKCVIEMCSGSEQIMAAMAIRVALISVSTLPKCDCLFLDEPGIWLDSNSMENFIKLLQNLRAYFKKIVLISHLDTLKECADMKITIDNKDGFAYINQ